MTKLTIDDVRSRIDQEDRSRAEQIFELAAAYDGDAKTVRTPELQVWLATQGDGVSSTDLGILHRLLGTDSPGASYFPLTVKALIAHGDWKEFRQLANERFDAELVEHRAAVAAYASALAGRTAAGSTMTQLDSETWVVNGSLSRSLNIALAQLDKASLDRDRTVVDEAKSMIGRVLKAGRELPTELSDRWLIETALPKILAKVGRDPSLLKDVAETACGVIERFWSNLPDHAPAVGPYPSMGVPKILIGDLAQAVQQTGDRKLFERLLAARARAEALTGAGGVAQAEGIARQLGDTRLTADVLRAKSGLYWKVDKVVYKRLVDVKDSAIDRYEEVSRQMSAAADAAADFVRKLTPEQRGALAAYWGLRGMLNIEVQDTQLMGNTYSLGAAGYPRDRLVDTEALRTRTHPIEESRGQTPRLPLDGDEAATVAYVKARIQSVTAGFVQAMKKAEGRTQVTSITVDLRVPQMKNPDWAPISPGLLSGP